MQFMLRLQCSVLALCPAQMNILGMSPLDDIIQIPQQEKNCMKLSIH